MIWDLSNFERSSLKELLASNQILEPRKINENYISICKCIFNIKILIHDDAKSDDIISSWKKANSDLKLDRLIKLFIRDSMYNLHITKTIHEEPDIILILRLVYWYYRCSFIESKNTFGFKKHEVREKLTKGLLNQREKISKQIDTINFDSFVDALATDWEQIQSRLLDDEPSNIPQLLDKSSIYGDTWFKDVWNVSSELLFAAICADNNFNITFQTLPKERNHDYDFIVNNFPVQMKSLNVGSDFLTATNRKQERLRNVQDDSITAFSVNSIIIFAITSKFNSINKALRQGAKIIFLNATTDDSGNYFSQYCLNSSYSFNVKISIDASIDLIKNDNNYVPLVFCATSFRLRYYIHTLAFEIPILTQGNERKIDRKRKLGLLQQL